MPCENLLIGSCQRYPSLQILYRKDLLLQNALKELSKSFGEVQVWPRTSHNRICSQYSEGCGCHRSSISHHLMLPEPGPNDV